MTKDSMDSFDVWKTWSKLSCGFLRAVSKSPKSLERVFISAPEEKRLHFWGCLVRQHGGWGAYTWQENEKHITKRKTFQVLHKPFNQGDSCHNPWQVRFWSKAYYGQHKNEASIWSYSKTDICTKKMSETLTTRCEVSEELSVINSYQSSPILSLLQEEVIINSSRSEITKNFNFFECNVNIQWSWPFQRICKIFSMFSISFP